MVLRNKGPCRVCQQIAEILLQLERKICYDVVVVTLKTGVFPLEIAYAAALHRF